MSALSWLNDLARWIAAWVPRLTLIPPTHRAVIFGPRGGAVTRGPGLVFWWPIAQKMVRLPVVRQAMETCARLLPTNGGAEALIPRAAVCGLVLEYVIEDPLLAATATVHLQSLIDNRGGRGDEGRLPRPVLPAAGGSQDEGDDGSLGWLLDHMHRNRRELF